MDVVCQLPRTSKRKANIFTLLDLAARYKQGEAVRKIKAIIISSVLTEFFSLFGLTVKLQTDGAPYCVGRDISNFCTTHCITHNVSNTYHLESQGTLERNYRTRKATVTKLCVVSNSVG